MDRLWVGLDVGEASTSVCVTDQEGGTLIECVVPTQAKDVCAAISAYGEVSATSIILEAGMGNSLVRELEKAGYSVIVLDAIKTRKFLDIRRNKTDTNDARGLAAMGRLRNVPGKLVHVKSAERQHLRSKLVIRDTMVRQRTAIDLTLRSLLREHGANPLAAPPNAGWRDNLPKAIDELRELSCIDLAQQAMPLADVREALNRYIQVSDSELAKFANANSVTRRFLQIPGVGPICALSFFTAIDDPQRFSRAANAGAYFGMTPKVQQSGVSLQHSRITKAGNKLTRSHLVLAAGVMISRARKESKLGDWGKSLRSRVGYSKARVAVARKLAVLMLSIWKSGLDFEPYPAGAPARGKAGLDPGHMSGGLTPYQEVGPSPIS